jgi:hypothetical protein
LSRWPACDSVLQRLCWSPCVPMPNLRLRIILFVRRRRCFCLYNGFALRLMLLATCGLAGQGGHRRRLQQNSGTTDSSEISLNIVAAGQSATKDFLSTWTSAGDLTAQSVEDSIQVLIVVVGIAIVGVACLCYAARLDYLDEKVKASEGTGVQTADGTGMRILSSSVSPHPG